MVTQKDSKMETETLCRWNDNFGWKGKSILGDPGAVIVGYKGFSWAKVYYKNRRAPVQLLLPNQFQKHLNYPLLIELSPTKIPFTPLTAPPPKVVGLFRKISVCCARGKRPSILAEPELKMGTKKTLGPFDSKKTFHLFGSSKVFP